MSQRKRQLTLSEILSNHNVDGRIYLCDIKRLLKWKVNYAEAEEIRKQLEQSLES